VSQIKNYYSVNLLFSDYSFPKEWEVLEDPLTDSQMLTAMIMKDDRTGIVLPLFKEEREEYLRIQDSFRKEAIAQSNRIDACSRVPSDDGGLKLKNTLEL
jgi:hypothetical protein